MRTTRRLIGVVAALALIGAACGDDDDSDSSADDTTAATETTAEAVRGQGRLAEAEQLFRAASEGYRTHFGPDHPGTLRTRESLAEVLSELEQETVADSL